MWGIDASGTVFRRPRGYALAHPELIALQRATGKAHIAHPTVMMRREALLAAGGYKPGEFPREDFHLWRRMAEIGQLHVIGEAVLKYRHHIGSVTARPREQRDGTMPTARRNAARLHAGWAYRALEHGYRGPARKHALLSWRADPFARRRAWVVFDILRRSFARSGARPG